VTGAPLAEVDGEIVPQGAVGHDAAQLTPPLAESLTSIATK
jgi:hypothetical protein